MNEKVAEIANIFAHSSPTIRVLLIENLRQFAGDQPSEHIKTLVNLFTSAFEEYA